MWQTYDLVFRLLSPLHVGYRKAGNLTQTRGYVPGRVLWAALTARMTRDAGQGATGSSYVEWGQVIQTSFRFTYLYPALPKQAWVRSAAHVQLYYPWEHELFDYRFLDSYASTALDYDQQSAEEGSLHETEFVRPHARPLPGETRAPAVYLTGQVYLRKPLEWRVVNWKKSLNRLQFGGERTYGWGRVELVACQLLQTSPFPPVAKSHNGHILAHALAVDTHERKAVADVTGAIEPWVGWEQDNVHTNRSWNLSTATICYAPGATAADGISFTIGPDGIWEASP